MPAITTWIVIFSIVTYFLVVLIQYSLNRLWKPLVVNVLFLFVVVCILNIALGFPKSVITFSGTSKFLGMLFMLISVSLGMAANYFYYADKFSVRDFVKPFLITPIVLFPLLGTIQTQGDLTDFQLLSFCFLAFQNGFFWKTLFDKAAKRLS